MARSDHPFRWFDSSSEVIQVVVMLYVRCPLSPRNVEEMVFERGIDTCDVTVINQERHLVSREIFKQRRSTALAEWKEVERCPVWGVATNWRQVGVD